MTSRPASPMRRHSWTVRTSYQRRRGEPEATYSNRRYENADARLADFLVELGHDVATVVADYPQRTLDRDLLEIARAEQRTIVTNDLDFGDLIVRERLPHVGII